MTVADLIADLRAEHAALDIVVGDLTDAQWRLPTPSPGWCVADQIAHLTFFDGTAVTAITDPEEFAAATTELLAGLGEGADMDELTIAPIRHLEPGDLLDRWRNAREGLLEAAGRLGDADRVPWYGPSMGAKSFLTARLMETWAHGQDVVDAVGAHRPPSDRLRHIAQLGVITRRWSYTVRGLDVPAGEVRVDLDAPSGAIWTWNDDGEAGTIRGPAEDFCLVVTQRRHVEDTDLEVEGAAATDWMAHAQAFAGAATEGPRPRN